MTLSQTLLWTVLPCGCTDTRLRFSIFLSPRLDPGTAEGRLGDFALHRWPEQVAAMSISLKLDSGVELPCTVHTEALNTNIWTGLFPDETLVTGHAFRDHSLRKLRSFPMSRLRQDIEGLYDNLAADPVTAADHPTFGSNGELDRLVDDLGDLPELIREHMGLSMDGGEEKLLGNIAGQPRKTDYFHAWRFYNSRLTRLGEPYPERDDNMVPPPPAPKRMDFHEAVASLGDQPSLLRALGLVIDVETERPEGGLAASGDVGVLSVSPKPGLRPIYLRTRFVFDENLGRFLPKPRPDSDLRDGQLALADSKRFDVSQIEVDGAALKLLEFATNMRRFRQAPKSTCPTTAAVPALQGGGFTISRVARAQSSTKQLAQQKLLHKSIEASSEPQESLPLDAEDVLRGFRVDVWHAETWRSLCERTGTVLVGPSGDAQEKLSISEEGYVKASAARSQTDQITTPPALPDLYLHEALFGWDGWSLVAQRPGRAVVPRPSDVPNPVNPNAKRGQVEEVKRVANLPASSGKLEVTSDVRAKRGSLPRLRFGQSYRFRVRTVDLAGNSLPPDLADDSQASAEQVFLRSEPVPTPVLAPRASYSEGEALEHMVVRSAVGDGMTAALFNAQNERHVLPPKASLTTVELHGMLDPLVAADPGYAYSVAVKEAGTLMDLEIWDPVTSSYVPAPGVKLVESPERIPIDPHDELPPRKGDPLEQNQYLVYVEDKVRLPYLPDPMAAGYVLWSPKAPTMDPISATFVGGWLDRESSRIVLRTGIEMAAQVTGAGIAVQLPPATIMRLRFASLPSEEDLDKMRWARDLGGLARKLAENGQHWMVTPYRELTLVHAVDCPIEGPHLTKLDPQRAMGSTFVELGGQMDVHGRSTGDVDLLASWTDYLDNPKEADGCEEIPRNGHVHTFKIGYDDRAVDFRRQVVRHELGDTKHRIVTYVGRGTTRYREYFPAKETADPESITRKGPDFPPISVPSSARPDAPHVLYVVPTFRWESGPDSSRRVGRGLRVYLDRPWFSSGEGELLGVVLANQPTGEIAKALRPYVSLWGRDPVWNSSEPKQELGPSHFANRVCTLPGLTLAELSTTPELSTTRVTAVGFTVEFCPERKLWYCDIEMTPQQPYQAFVRLVFARLQPDSLPGAHLSSVVATEFAQLLADRTATITRGKDGRILVRVSGITARNDLAIASPKPFEPPVVAPSIQPTAPSKAQRAQAGGVPSGQTAPPELRPVLVANPVAGHGHVVRAQIESRLKLKQGHSDLDWSPVGAPVVLASYTAPAAVSSTVTWQGELDFAIRDPKREYRLRLTEHELFLTDPDVAQNDVAVFPPQPVRERLAYLDLLPLLP